MSAPVRWQSRWVLPDVEEFFESIMPAQWRPRADRFSLRVEQYVEDGRYVVRAELPGIDPDKDVEITVDDSILTITAERSETKTHKDRSEFRYGSFQRQIALPRGTKDEDVTANYHDGILTITVPVKEGTASHKVEVRHDE